MKIKITISGISPLMMSKFSEEQLNGNKVVNKNELPREAAEKYAYRTNTGELYIPAQNIFCAIIDAGKFHKLGKNKITTLKSTLITAGVTFEEGACLLGTKEYEVDSRSCVVPATGGRIMVHRPRLDKWETSFSLTVDENMFSEKTIRMIIDDAGKKCGIMAFRPSLKGWYGKFVVTKWESEKD